MGRRAELPFGASPNPTHAPIWKPALCRTLVALRRVRPWVLVKAQSKTTARVRN